MTKNFLILFLLSFVFAACGDVESTDNKTKVNVSAKDNHDGHDHSGHDHSGHDHSGHDHSGHDHSGHDHSGHDHSGHDHSGHDHSGHDHSGHDHSGHDHAAHAGDGKHFGAKIADANTITYEALLASMKDKKQLQTKVKGTVESVCQAKGCWMQLVAKDGKGETMRVTFKDYAFFVPKNIAGQKVVVEGLAEKKEVSVADQQHYLEDEGASKEAIAAITEPAQELIFEATGVLLLDGK